MDNLDPNKPDIETEGKSEKGAIDNVVDKLKDKQKDTAKKPIKKIIMQIVKAIVPWLIKILIPIIVFTIIVSSIKRFLELDSTRNANNAKAIVVDSVDFTGNNDLEKKISINKNTDNDKGNYSLDFIYSSEEEEEEDLKRFKDKFEEYNFDISEFTDFEIKLIGEMEENGLDLNNLLIEEIKCLPIFLKAEFATRYLDLRTREKMIIDGEYKSGDASTLEEEEFFGTIQVHRSSKDNPTGEVLEYIKYDEFKNLVDNHNNNSDIVLKILSSFTIDDKDNLIVASWNSEETKYETTEGTSSGLPDGSKSYSLDMKAINYKELTNQYTMPYEFLASLLYTTHNPEFCIEIAKLAFSSQIVINVHEEMFEMETIEISDYVEFERVYDEEEDDYIEVKVKEYQITKTTIVKENTYSFEITKADIWYMFCERKYQRFEERDKLTTNLGTVYDTEESGDRIVKITTTTILNTVRYIKQADPPMEKKAYDDPSKGFLKAYDENQDAQSTLILTSRQESLYEKLEDNVRTIRFSDIMKYLFHKYYNIDTGVDNIDDLLDLFGSGNFDSVDTGRWIVVKTDKGDPNLILTKNQIKEAIEKGYTGQKQTNLLSALDAFYNIQQTNQVNPLFAVAVTIVESSGGTDWKENNSKALISKNTYNWMSVQGAIGGGYIDRNGTSWNNYNSFSHATESFGNLIQNNYFPEKTNVGAIAESYCKPPDRWARDVSNEMIRLYGLIDINMLSDTYADANDTQLKIAEIARNSASNPNRHICS